MKHNSEINDRKAIEAVEDFITFPDIGLIRYNYTGIKGNQENSIKIKTEDWSKQCPVSKNSLVSIRDYSQKIKLFAYEYMRT